MYLNYFGLVEKPFSIAPDPQYLYMSARHKEAMAHLSYGLSQGGCFIVLTGEVGTGKTTLCRNLLADLPKNVDVALILNPNINRRELLETVCDELKIRYRELQSKKRLLDKINRFLLKRYAEGRHTVLIIDEAQLLSRTVLEQIRLLTNLETTKAKLLQIILIGQPELNDLLARQDLRQLAQRVTARYHLPAIGKQEIQDYVNFRLSVAGCKKHLFSVQALKLLHQSTGGIPRKINVLADHALLSAYANSQPMVDAKTIKKSAKEMMGARSARSLPKWLPIGASLAAALVLMNLSLWWWFSNSDAQTQTPIAQEQKQGQTRTAGAVPSSSDQPSRAPQNDKANGNVDLSKLGDGQSSMTTIVKSEDVAPGSVVIADEFLDDSSDSSSSVPRLTDPLPNSPQLLANVQPVKVPPAYLATSPFGRVLDVSPDRTGRIAAFKNLAAAWDVELPENLLGPICKELEQRGVICQSAASWSSLMRLNRPTIMVLAHKGVEHRVILYRVDGDTASVLVGDQNYQLPVSELKDRWAQSAIIFWRPTQIGNQLLQLGDENVALPLVRQSLNAVFQNLDIPPLANTTSTRFDFELTDKVTRLQERFDLQVDGKIGRETYLLLNELTQADNVPVLRNRG